MRNADDWTCPCGHEIDPDGLCIVWDQRGNDHRAADNEGKCRCHGKPLALIEAGPW